MIKVLAIGNSFSEDSTYYLHDMLTSFGLENQIVNLYYPGCSIKQHWEHLNGHEKVYIYQENKGSNPNQQEKMVEIDEVMRSQEWDIIVSHQSSHDSGIKSTYEPFLNYLYSYFKKVQPKAKLFLQETWAYEIDSNHDKFYLYNHSQEKMFNLLRENYHYYAEKLDLNLIPTGEIVQKLRKIPLFDYKNGGMSICRDGFHLNYLYGRYMVALVWSKYIFKIDVKKATFVPHTDLTQDILDEDKLSVIKDLVGNS